MSPKPALIPLRPLLIFAVALVAIVAVALLRPGGRAAAAEFHGTPYTPPEPAPAFQLTDHTGRAANLAEFRGEPVLLFFGFTHCPAVCPLTLTQLNRVLGGMGEHADDIRILLVTVDPAQDTPAVLAQYVAPFEGRLVGLTGDAPELARIRHAYGVYAGAGGEAGGGAHGMAHTDAIFGIDRTGRIRVLMNPGSPDEQIRDDIRTLLRL